MKAGIIFFTVVTVLTKLGVAQIDPPPRITDCFINGTIQIKLGESYPGPIGGNCFHYVCDAPGDYYTETCFNNGRPQLVLPSCYLKDGDKSKPYPDCCPKLVCPTE